MISFHSLRSGCSLKLTDWPDDILRPQTWPSWKGSIQHAVWDLFQQSDKHSLQLLISKHNQGCNFNLPVRMKSHRPELMLDGEVLLSPRFKSPSWIRFQPLVILIWTQGGASVCIVLAVFYCFVVIICLSSEKREADCSVTLDGILLASSWSKRNPRVAFDQDHLLLSNVSPCYPDVWNNSLRSLHIISKRGHSFLSLAFLNWLIINSRQPNNQV